MQSLECQSDLSYVDSHGMFLKMISLIQMSEHLTTIHKVCNK